MDNQNNEELQMSADDKLARVFLAMKAYAPFYNAVYSSMEKVESDSIDTIGVSCEQLVYNKKFVEGLTHPELMFISLHEIFHIALMHPARACGKDRHLYNIAADLVVNKLISDEFNLLPGNTYVKDKTTDKYNLTFPEDGLFSRVLNTDTVSVEDIYAELEKQAQTNGYTKDVNSGIESDKGHKFRLPASLLSHGNSHNPSDDFVLDVYVKHEYSDDLMDTGDDANLQETKNRQILNDASIRNEMQKGNGIGTGSSKLERMVKTLLDSHIDWRKLLRKYLIHITSSDSTFINPDKRMFYQSAIYPGQDKDGDLALRDVKVCFDSSGSISDEDLARFHGQVLSLTKQFKLSAEAMYWDTEVESKANIKNFRELKNAKAAGYGGTDPSCLFKYFDSKKCKHKPSVILIFTDGYICRDALDKNTKWHKKYKDTIWIITKDGDEKFKPPFGKVTYAKYSK